MRRTHERCRTRFFKKPSFFLFHLNGLGQEFHSGRNRTQVLHSEAVFKRYVILIQCLFLLNKVEAKLIVSLLFVIQLCQSRSRHGSLFYSFYSLLIFDISNNDFHNTWYMNTDEEKKLRFKVTGLVTGDCLFKEPPYQRVQHEAACKTARQTLFGIDIHQLFRSLRHPPRATKVRETNETLAADDRRLFAKTKYVLFIRYLSAFLERSSAGK